MIQRVQSIFLFLVAVAMLLVLLFPIWHQVNPAQTEMTTLNAYTLKTVEIASQETVSQEGKYFIAGLALLAMGLALFSLSQYKDRGKQMLINMINSIVMVTNVGLIVWTAHSANEAINPQVNGAFVLGFYAIFGGMIMNLLANRFIRKDEMLVRSVDRIR